MWKVGKFLEFLIIFSPLMLNYCHKSLFYVTEIQVWRGRRMIMPHYFQRKSGSHKPLAFNSLFPTPNKQHYVTFEKNQLYQRDLDVRRVGGGYVPCLSPCVYITFTSQSDSNKRVFFFRTSSEPPTKVWFVIIQYEILKRLDSEQANELHEFIDK